MENNLYILNPDYILKHDLKRTFLLSKLNTQLTFSQKSWFSIIHPVQAMIFSFFSEPDTLDNSIGKISEFLGLDKNQTEKLISPYIENIEPYDTEYQNEKFRFPKKLIIKYTKKIITYNKYNVDDFVYIDLDFKSDRMFVAPKSIVLMVNNVCVTDCIYCYADKTNKVKCQIPFFRIKEIIKDAQKNKVTDFEIVGGEFFLYENWFELLHELKDYGFIPSLISTKLPLKEEDIIKLTNFKEIKYQISLDTINIEESQQLLNVKKDYIKQIINTLKLFDKYEIKYSIATVLTKINLKKESLESLYSFLSELKYITKWNLRLPFKSIYSKIDFEHFKINDIKEVEDIFEYLCNINSEKKLNIILNKSIFERGYNTAEDGTKSFNGAKCTALATNIFILPDGNVTICEQLYWKEQFIIGNILTHNIQEIWNSPKSLSLAFPKPEEFRDEIECKKCELFENCFHEYHNKCWADTIKAYGEENYDFPDPRCIKAPKITHKLN
jgi:radical SAM protein with 4Fe4S-binding SPASM domain